MNERGKKRELPVVGFFSSDFPERRKQGVPCVSSGVLAEVVGGTVLRAGAEPRCRPMSPCHCLDNFIFFVCECVVS